MKKYKLSDLFDIQIGRTPLRANKDYWGGSNIWVSIRDINNLEDGKYIGTSKEYISDIGVAESGINVIPANTLLYSFKLSIGKVAITKMELYTNEAIAALIPNGKYDINLDFFFFQLKNLKIDDSLFNNAVKGKSLNKSTLGQIEIFCPAVEVQNNIANTLNNVFTIISKRQRTIELLNEYMKSTFLDMFGDPYINPMEWETNVISKYCDSIVPGRNKPKIFDGNIPWIKTENIYDLGFIVENNNNLLSHDEIINSRNKLIPIGSVIMTSTGNVGSVSMVNIECVPNQQLHCFVCKGEILPEFLMFVIYFQREHIENMADDMVIKYLNKEKCESIRVIKPPLDKQGLFRDCFYRKNNLEKELNLSLNFLQELFQSFQHSLFNFEKNINELEFIIRDQVKMEQLQDNLSSSNYESTSIYDRDKNILFEVLEHTEKRNKEAKDNNEEYLYGLVLKLNDKKKIELKTNRDDKYETN